MTPNNNFERICVIGLGYIGLPTSAALAARGFSIHGVEVNASVVDTINAGDTHIVEPELDLLVRAAVRPADSRRTSSPPRPTSS